MIGKRTAVELLACATGLAAAFMIGSISAWAYPLGRDNIWLVTWVSMVVVVVLNAGQIRRAMAADRAPVDGAPG